MQQWCEDRDSSDALCLNWYSFKSLISSVYRKCSKDIYPTATTLGLQFSSETGKKEKEKSSGNTALHTFCGENFKKKVTAKWYFAKMCKFSSNKEGHQVQQATRESPRPCHPLHIRLNKQTAVPYAEVPLPDSGTSGNAPM